jgi:hypothetical protein
MPSNELAFFTSDELIEELVRRRTFYGCVIRSTEEHKDDVWEERTFQVQFNSANLDRVRVGRLLDAMAEMLLVAV